MLSFGAEFFVFSMISKNLKIKIYRTIILRVILYGCETWSLTLREERRLRVFENRVLRINFGPVRDEGTEEWKKLHNEEVNEMYSPNIFRVIKSRRMRWVGHVARMGERSGVYTVLVGIPEGKIPHGRPRRRWEDNTKYGSSGIGMWGRELDRAGSGSGHVAGTCGCGNEPSGSVKCVEFLGYLRTG